jgi:hypothetical protein
MAIAAPWASVGKVPQDAHGAAIAGHVLARDVFLSREIPY